MINIPKGTKDVLPEDAFKWHYVENTARKIAAAFNVKEIRTPVFEHTELFLRGVGDTTDIVNKEMYTFKDKGDRSITLKPEGTAGVARSFIQNSMNNGVLPLKVYYFTPVFRYENPQEGRLREHHQFGIEFFGAGGADSDAEAITLAHTFFKELRIKNIELNINSIGCPKCRPSYNLKLKEYLAPYIKNMCPTCQSRYDKNPLRILDCKEDACKEINKFAPKITEHLCEECSTHFESLKSFLALSGIEYKINPYIVRGLDYYSKTVFEFVSNNIGSQGTVCGGGRYDTLIESLGGVPTPCVGFGLGLERLLLLMEKTSVAIPAPENIAIYIVSIGEAAHKKAYEIAINLKRSGITAEFDHLSRGVKPQFKYADKIGAKYVAVIGDSELESGNVTLKNMFNGETFETSFAKLEEVLKTE